MTQGRVRRGTCEGGRGRGIGFACTSCREKQVPLLTDDHKGFAIQEAAMSFRKFMQNNKKMQWKPVALVILTLAWASFAAADQHKPSAPAPSHSAPAPHASAPHASAPSHSAAPQGHSNAPGHANPMGHSNAPGHN